MEDDHHLKAGKAWGSWVGDVRVSFGTRAARWMGDRMYISPLHHGALYACMICDSAMLTMCLCACVFVDRCVVCDESDASVWLP